MSEKPPRDGPGIVHYVIVLVIVAIIVFVVLALLGPNVGNVFSGMTNL